MCLFKALVRGVYTEIIRSDFWIFTTLSVLVKSRSALGDVILTQAASFQSDLRLLFPPIDYIQSFTCARFWDWTPCVSFQF